MRRHFTLAGLLVAASGCALSPVVDELYDASELEPAYESDAEAEPPPSSDEPEDKASAMAPAEERDAAAGSDGKSDAGHARDAGVGSPRDAGRVTPVTAPGLPVSRAGEALTDAIRDLRGSCNVATDCKTSCVPLGIATCCRTDKTCGCTWAPGAYCL